MSEETCCCHIGYSFRLTARVLLYAPSHRQDSTYHSLCYTSRGALAGTRNSSMGSPHEGSIRRPIAPRSYITLLSYNDRFSWQWEAVKIHEGLTKLTNLFNRLVLNVIVLSLYNCCRECIIMEGTLVSKHFYLCLYYIQ